MTEDEEEQGVSREIYQLEMICALISVDRETYLVSSRGRGGGSRFTPPIIQISLDGKGWLQSCSMIYYKKLTKFMLN